MIDVSEALGATDSSCSVRRLDRPSTGDLVALVEILCECVNGGASVGFLAPLDERRAGAYWEQVATEVAAGRRALLVADDAHGPVGTVQVVPAAFENQPHRADLVKLLVHRRGRNGGVGTALVAAAERTAAELGRTLLVLDTVPGSDAERLYRRLGWTAAGTVSDYAMMPDGEMSPTTFFYRRVGARSTGVASR